METKVIREIQDLTYLNWSKTRGSSGTAGSFLKAYSELNGVKTYYKLSDYDTVKGVVGHESVNEIIADRLLTKLGIEHLHYQLIHANILVDGRMAETRLCASEDFKQRGESKIALDQYYNTEKLPETTFFNEALHETGRKCTYRIHLYELWKRITRTLLHRSFFRFAYEKELLRSSFEFLNSSSHMSVDEYHYFCLTSSGMVILNTKR